MYTGNWGNIRYKYKKICAGLTKSDWDVEPKWPGMALGGENVTETDDQIVCTVDWKTGQVTLGTQQWQRKAHEKVTTITVDRFTLYHKSEHVLPFEQFHDRLGGMAREYKFDMNELLVLVKNSPTVRISAIEKHLDVPRFVAQKIATMFMKSKAAVPYHSGFRKEKQYAKYLLEHSAPYEGVGTLRQQDDRFTYYLPSDDALLEMSSIELSGEIEKCETAELKKTKRTQYLKILNQMRASRREIERAEREQSRLSDVDRLKKEIRVMKDENREDRKMKRQKEESSNE